MSGSGGRSIDSTLSMLVFYILNFICYIVMFYIFMLYVLYLYSYVLHCSLNVFIFISYSWHFIIHISIVYILLTTH